VSRTLRSDCPIAAGLDIFGDRWTLLVLRDMLLRGKSHYGEFATEESIASNILADRLGALVQLGIIERVADPDDGRKYTYRPLEPAIELLPVIADIAAWGAKYTDVTLPAELQPISDPSTRRQIVSRMTKQLSKQIAERDRRT